MEKNEIIKAAEKFCEDHQVTRYPVGLIAICRNLEISVFEQPLPKSVSGFIVIQDKPFQSYGTGRLIVANSGDSAGRKKFTIAHELAHYVLHRKDGTIYAHRDAGQSGGIETEANIFASNLLMPKSLIYEFLQMYDGCTESFRAEQVSRAFAVSRDAAIVRLGQLGLMGG